LRFYAHLLKSWNNAQGGFLVLLLPPLPPLPPPLPLLLPSSPSLLLLSPLDRLSGLAFALHTMHRTTFHNQEGWGTCQLPEMPVGICHQRTES
jgi:hypothetical protein